MQSEEHDNDLNAADRELEAALRSLAPSRASGINAIDAAYAAGNRAARRHIRLWQSAAAAMLLVAVGSWIPLTVSRTAPSSVIATAPNPVVTVASTAPVVSPPPQHSLLMLQEAVRERGVDGLPATELPTIRNLRVADFF